MVFPFISAWIEKARNATGARINKGGLRLLVVVAPETAEAQVVETACAASRFRGDVVNGELVTCIVHERAKAFAQNSALACEQAGAAPLEFGLIDP